MGRSKRLDIQMRVMFQPLQRQKIWDQTLDLVSLLPTRCKLSLQLAVNLLCNSILDKVGLFPSLFILPLKIYNL